MTYRLTFMTEIQWDARNPRASGLKQKTEKLLHSIQRDPLGYPPPFEYLKGDMRGLR
uniref:Uncharacterized protein n=1 Tax=Candidatus Kentrum sp. FM TaxID=2126340 RepID=A0A450SXJ3_9GAMM|nr:MAG: hypothetical protein BECKFM1743A_GA0114220_102244 [Candidatus Kentron sp. FM]VFJ60370.1 MAG: hypothetical protein BECKFM1743C_GA0114222_102715 [Candidatus Kentron sp. FM]VFK12806.1 MAG: hypothetical protein BECKFM1743B_GA0114221_102556 [Candidatus Kentron sp. FM]